MQSRRLSAYEAITNMAVGSAINMVIGVVYFGAVIGDTIQTSLTHSGALTGIYLITSTVRTYFLRRAFERIKAGCDVL